MPILPISLDARSGGTPTAASFETLSGVRPSFSMEIQNHDPEKGLFEFNLTVDRATIPDFPIRCEGQPLTTNLSTTFIIDDGANPPVVIMIEQPWRCGRNDLRTP